MNYKIGDKVIVVSNKGKFSDEPMHCFNNGTVCTITKTWNDDIIEIEAKWNDIRTKQKTYAFNVEKYEGE